MHLIETLAAYQARDPAARSKLEVFLLYPGVHATINHRIAHWLYNHRCRFLARDRRDRRRLPHLPRRHPGRHRQG